VAAAGAGGGYYIVLGLVLYRGMCCLLHMHSLTHIGWCAGPSLGPPEAPLPPSKGFPLAAYICNSLCIYEIIDFCGITSPLTMNLQVSFRSKEICIDLA
jgi:hypothetical protein